MKKVSILGSTGSIGKQALEVIRKLKDQFEVYGLAAGSNFDNLKAQIDEFKPKVVSVKEKSLYSAIKSEYKNIEVLYGDEGLTQIAGDAQNVMVLIAVTGLSGLYPTLAAINNNIDIALANKETLVAAGNIVMQKAKKNNVKILPVDSEHSAIFQCIDGKDYSEIKKLIITGSGGPFRNKSLEEIAKASVKETLAHPNWAMGNKITVDSATLMNKGLEVIEAHWLFGVAYENIEVVIHPQSIIHSAVEYLDGSTIAQLGIPSMHIPIQYAMTYPKRYEGIATGTMNFFEAGKLEFEKPDLEKFHCLKLAFEAGKKGGTYPAVLNAVNEESVYAFLDGKIKLIDIPKLVEKALETHSGIKNPELNEIIEADKWARNIFNDLFIKCLD